VGKDDFYVPDEPVAEVLAAYEAGDKGVTAPPSGTRGAGLVISHGSGSLAGFGVNSAIAAREAHLTLRAATYMPNAGTGLAAST
jgi:hypothetical protein